MKIIVASDSFKGTFSSLEIAELVKNILTDHEVIPIAISDGGEGFCDAAISVLGGRKISLEVTGPMYHMVKASYGITDSNTAIIEMAQASGLLLVSPEDRNPWKATTYGTGQLIHDAIDRGCRDFIIGLGGSATNDCGKGMLDALSDTKALDDCHFLIASDVKNPLCGPNGATYVFARQKGATDDMLEALEKRNMEYGRFLEKKTGRTIVDVQGAGAAGGVGAAFLSMRNVELCSGIDLMLKWQHFDTLLDSADLVITGEGCLDRQTLKGKAPYGIACRAKARNVPCVMLCGRNELTESELTHSPFDKVVLLSDFYGARDGGVIIEN